MGEHFRIPVRIALIGSSGFIGQAHLNHILQEKDCELAALVDTAPSVATTAKEHNVPHFPDIDRFLKAYNSGTLAVDAVILATPTQTHVSLTQQFEGSGLALLIEKPLSATGEDGKALLALSKRDTKGVYMVGHHRRHNAYVKSVKHVLEEKKLGTVTAVNGVWAMRKSDAYFDIPWHTQLGAGGVILTNAIHDLDMLQYWLGDIAEVFAIEGNKERPHPVDSTVQITFKFASGVVGSFLMTEYFASLATNAGGSSSSHLSWEAATGDNPSFASTGEDFLTFFGTKGSISVPSLVRYHYDDLPEKERNWNFPLQKDESAKDEIDGVPAFEHQLRHFIAVARREREPNCSVKDGLRAVLVTEAVFRSLETGRPCLVERL